MRGTVNGAAPALPAQGSQRGDRRPRFLDGKLQVPRPSFDVLHRPRVSALLAEATRHRVTLVCGPAGAGKTVACASWAARKGAARRAAWVTLDAQDRHDWFWACVSGALSRVPSLPAQASRALSDTRAGRFPLRLAEVAQTFPQPVTLIFDDVHEVTDECVLAGLDTLIRYAPPPLRLVLLARRPPALQLARLCVAGELADIGGNDLACTQDEADAYFAMLGLRVAPAERNEVLRRTEGWMAGLRLAAMRAGGEVTALTGSEPLVTDYLWDEVLARQEPRTREFLVRTSILAELSGDLADALTGQAGSARVLARLSRENSFVSRLDEAGTYRYHPLLREVLTAQLHREYGHEVPGLLRRPPAGTRARAGRSARSAARPPPATGTWRRARWRSPAPPR
jgi:LuxR family transcriptional regulator, maltose regulon positive regulatory protein